ncbi:MAG: hypothetical protein ABI579_06510 [Candidatus Sumerlaeota bacterium]
MVLRRNRLLITSILAAGICGYLTPAPAQDPAPAGADPFAEVGTTSNPAATTFQPNFGNAPATDANASPANTTPVGPAVTGGPIEASQFKDTTPLADSVSPFGGPSAAVGPPITADLPPGALAPAGDTTASATPAVVDASVAPNTAISQGIIAPGSEDAAALTSSPSSPFGSGPTSSMTSGEPAPASGNTANNGKGISQLYEFRYVPSATFNGRKIVTRKQLTRDEAAAFDTAVSAEFSKLAEEGKLPNQRFAKGVGNSQEWGQWMLYAFQLQNWSIYCRDVALGGTGFKFNPDTDIHWPGDPKPNTNGQAGVAGDQFGGGGKDGGGRPQRPANIVNENRSLDDQVLDFVPIPDTRGGTQQAVVVDPKQMDDQAKTIYNNFLTELRSEEKKQTAFLKKLAGDIDQRARDRQAYGEWRDNQKRIVLDYVNDWNRRYEGKVVTVAGVRYELYKPGTVPTNTTRYANIVVTDYELTPYDLLNDDGSLRGPAK